MSLILLLIQIGSVRNGRGCLGSLKKEFAGIIRDLNAGYKQNPGNLCKKTAMMDFAVLLFALK